MTNKLASKVTLLTGSPASHCEAFRHEGARVFITGCHQALMDQAVASIGGDAAAIKPIALTSLGRGNSRFPRNGVDPGLAV